jgi:hypothetical protein
MNNPNDNPFYANIDSMPDIRPRRKSIPLVSELVSSVVYRRRVIEIDGKLHLQNLYNPYSSYNVFFNNLFVPLENMSATGFETKLTANEYYYRLLTHQKLFFLSILFL